MRRPSRATPRAADGQQRVEGLRREDWEADASIIPRRHAWRLGGLTCMLSPRTQTGVLGRGIGGAEIETACDQAEGGAIRLEMAGGARFDMVAPVTETGGRRRAEAGDDPERGQPVRREPAGGADEGSDDTPNLRRDQNGAPCGGRLVCGISPSLLGAATLPGRGMHDHARCRTGHGCNSRHAKPQRPRPILPSGTEPGDPASKIVLKPVVSSSSGTIGRTSGS